ncbi:uncharacterized protein LOC131077962 isoform X2 [Cryptomeria japonica]|uniref:uncharacterized protein LOC131077962 isoform X2 n=1 Tax=Cryptomeria japonica TaxID=3369 RepID=UPI0025ABCDCB|nr:uncharacterized protein LOC131077962 isoform X2 [Cryptomeria japonica]
MISFSQTKQWHGVQFQQFKLTKSLPKCLNGHPNVHLRSFRPSSDRKMEQASFKTVHCKAGLAEDAPFAIAIGTCVLNSIIFPPRDKSNDQDGESMDDVRYAAMGIISFIPYFNWLSWVFAWLDTGRRQYLIYAIVYLAPYIRSDLSISLEDSWLPVASILVCILHIQLEISLKSGDLQDFQLFGDTSFFSENWGGKRLQNQLGILLQKLRASKVTRESPRVFSYLFNFCRKEIPKFRTS